VRRRSGKVRVDIRIFFKHEATWYGQNGMDKMVYGQNGIGQNGLDKWYGQNGRIWTPGLFVHDF